MRNSAAELGLTPFDTAAHTAVEVEEFYGTSYSKSRLWNAVPDTLSPTIPWTMP